MCHGFGTPLPLKLVRPVQALLMMRCSLQAQREHAPAERPWLISRSGMPGMQRYAQTWSGDNYTEWKTIRWNLRMGLGLSLSGLFNLGHDVGGFAGPAPEPELLVRWVQSGIFSPRFTIHSWNTDLHGVPNGSCNEPWMHAEVTDLVRDALCFRYTLLPYLYELLRRAHKEYEPIVRPTFLDHQHDAATFEACDDFLLGPGLLVCTVVERGALTRDVYLPDNGEGWWDWHRGVWMPGGQRTSVAAPLHAIPLFAAAGAMVPLAEGTARAALDGGAERWLRIFPKHGFGWESNFSWVEDDGVATGPEAALRVLCRLRGEATALHLDVSVAPIGKGYAPPFGQVRLVLPSGETRPLHVQHLPPESSSLPAAPPPPPLEFVVWEGACPTLCSPYS